ncbi:oxidoreductase 2OG-Fe(II) oxygenase family [Penicillium angulare]|uniref:Oxidoreductase 2OG-Fe(II) oxygenase family n=1 Tax=Penicillium angulare TaxID=116970 RepID=A0A9W9FYU9_9EURO|nr:oxidoreductase 2OG-Fe(II) oxygenase family [Penicillium angulare]
MPTPKYFQECPPFPADTPVHDLPTVSFLALKAGDTKESERLYEACRAWGFFLLDLRESEDGKTLLQDAEKMYDLTRETYSLDQSILDEYAYNPPYDLTGYKQKGKLKTDDGKMDCMELYSINQDDMMGNRPTRKYIDTIEHNRSDVVQFIQHSHAAISVIMSRLDEQLGLPPGTLNALSPLDQVSETSVRLLLTESQSTPQYDTITLGGHTDIGTATLLFHVIGGLQILPAGKENKMENWSYVKPEPGFALVNLGDTIVEWTGGLLRSSLHRVITAPGEQATVPRQSLAYLVRPRNSATMNRLKGGVIPLLVEGEEDETRSVTEWAAWRSKQVIAGELKAQTRGGYPIVPAQTAV